MKFITSVLLLITFLVTASCQITYRQPPFSVHVNKPFSHYESQEEEIEKFEGFGVSLETGQVIEVTSTGSIILNRFGTYEPEFIEIEETDITDESKDFIDFVFDGELVSFQKPGYIEKRDVTGKWFYYLSDDGYESSQKITYESDGYFFDSVELFHDDQSYSKYSQFFNYRFSNGFVFEGYFEEGESYWYFLIEVSENEMTFIDEDGVIWTERRYTNQQHVNIPDFYFNETF